MYMYIHAPIFYEKIFFPHLNLCKKFLEQEKNCDIIKAKKIRARNIYNRALISYKMFTTIPASRLLITVFLILNYNL